MAANVFGDITSGQHGTFLKLPGGFVSPPHTHTDDYFGIVVSGLVANGTPGSEDVVLPSGSYWFQRGGEAHVTKCLSPEGCLNFIYQPGKFDFIPAN